jgi:bifunctional non-homologous end joining protein LigD
VAEPFTVATPRSLPANKQGEHWFVETDGRRVRLSNLDKIFWPDHSYTKGDLLAYYFNIAPLILPHLYGRPLTMRRMPDGAAGKEFYEKNAPSHTPEWIPRCQVESESGGTDFLMADSVAALLFVTNLGCIEFHPLHARCDRPDLPDYLFFDLDPHPPIDFSDVLAVAHHVITALEALNLPWYAKTSGKSGMQIYVPIRRGPTFEHVRGFVGAIGRAIRDADPGRVTMEPNKPKRAGKVYIDHNMNRWGANIAAVYSLRPRPEATVSTPLTKDEIEAGEVRPEDFTMANVHQRLELTGELFSGMLTGGVDLRPVLDSLGLPGPSELADEGETSGTGAGPALAPTASAPRTSDVASVSEKLATYDAKRDFAATPEPAGGDMKQQGKERRGGVRGGTASGASGAPPGKTSNRFVIQKHAATRLHYDLRLERDGVLLSWAVPKGLPTMPGERRLAVRTEDHPLEYLDFEAVIPKGQYGAGEMRIFDRGTYEVPEWEEKKATIQLHGERVRGEYHLVNTRGKDWIVFLSKRSAPIAPPPQIEPMLAEGGGQPFSDPGWIFEPKLDGIRTLAYVSTDGTRLFSRTGRDHTSIYPELSNLATYVNALYAVLDGEIVATDQGGRPSFEVLQQRMNLSSPEQIDRVRRRLPVSIHVFDLLWLDERNLMSEPLHERRRILQEVLTEAGPVSLTLTHAEDGKAFFAAAKELGIEGIIAKKLDSAYEPGRRSHHWRKIKAMRTLDSVILGWTPGTGSRSSTFGALLLGAYKDGSLAWIGQVGTGFSGKLLGELQAKLESIETDKPTADDSELAALEGARWVRPELVCEVSYLELTKAGKLRAPSYQRLRPDKSPRDCTIT